MTIFLETERLVIKHPHLSDLDDMYRLQADPIVMEYVGKGIRTREEVLHGLTLAIEHQKQHGFSLGSVFEKASGQFVGRAGIIYLAFDDRQEEIEIGYALIPEAWHKGYATELATGLIKWGFEHLPVTKLVGITRAENQRSRQVLQKAGMHCVGKERYNQIEVLRYEIVK